MPKIVKIKRSNVAGSTPVGSYGELAYNAADNKLFAFDAANRPVVVGAGGSGGGGSANIVEAATTAGFPAGAVGTIYIATDFGRVYRFDASGVFIEIGN
jgi:outer membrane protein assembly factor BamB